MATSKTFFVDKLSKDVSSALSKQENLNKYKNNIDKFIAANSDKLMTVGPSGRPIFGTTQINDYTNIVGLSTERIKSTLKESSSVGDNWFVMNNPFNIANALALHYFVNKNNAKFIRYTQWYLTIALYPTLHYKYFRYPPNEACMNYTINNLSEKYKIKKAGSLWNALKETTEIAYDLHKDKIKKGEDTAFIAYISDVHTRINSLLRNISNQYYDNFENQRYLQMESDIFDEDNYYEADSNSFIIERLTNQVVTHMVVHGPDMRLVKFSATSNNVSVNEMRNYTNSIVTESHRSEVHGMVESILYLFLNSSEKYTVRDISTNNFMIYCLKVYKKSHTGDRSIRRIRDIIAKWIDDLGVEKKYKSPNTITQFKKALYTFFVVSIQKNVK